MNGLARRSHRLRRCDGRIGRWRLAALLLPLLAAACAMGEQGPPATDPALSVVAAPAPPVPDSAGAATPVPPTPKPRPSRPRENAAIPPPPPPADPRMVLGLTEGEAETLIGPPRESADAPPARVWVYDGRRCTMKVFFYFDLGRRTFRALTFSIDHDDTERADEHRCFGQILNDARARV